jgi:Pvc16 N-terminal domain
MIGLISESLRNLLEAEMTPVTKVTLLSPADTSSQQKRINLFLYRVTPNPFLNNGDWLPKPGAPGRLVLPPLAVNLYYLLTAYAQLDPQTGLADAHGLMAEAMRVLHEHPIVPQAFLENGLEQGEVKVTLHGTDVEELSKVWTALNKEYRLSAVYEVAYAEIPARRERPMPPRAEVIDLDVVATDRRPVVLGMRPRTGATGTILQFTGEDLRGWKATVRIGGQFALQDQPPASDVAFSAPVPAGLAPGVYEVVVDVGGLTQFRGAFEVTP